MTDFYDYSKQAGELVNLAQQLLNFHLVRYKHFVDTSTLGEECRYAKITQSLFHKEAELPKLKAHLGAMHSYIEQLAEALDQIPEV